MSQYRSFGWQKLSLQSQRFPTRPHSRRAGAESSSTMLNAVVLLIRKSATAPLIAAPMVASTSRQACWHDPDAGAGVDICTNCREHREPTKSNVLGVFESCNEDEDCCGDSVCSHRPLLVNCQVACSDDNDPDLSAIDKLLIALGLKDAADNSEIVVCGLVCDEETPPSGRCRDRVDANDIVVR